MTAKKILIVQFGRIGDLILMTPMFQAIKDANPENRVHLLAGRNNYHFALDYPLIDKVHVYEKKPWKTVQFILSLKKERFDFWIDPKDHLSIESYFFAKFAAAGFKVGFHSERRPLFDRTVPIDKEQAGLHAVERNLYALQLAGIAATVHRPVLFTDGENDQCLNAFLSRNKIKRYLCINVSANKKERYWLKEKWIELVGRLGYFDQHILFISKPEDMEMLKRLSQKDGRVFVYPTASVKSVFSVIKKADLLITPDTAVIHIAGAFNTPVIGLYAGHQANLIKFRPLSDHSRVIQDPISVRTIQHIEVDTVFNAVQDILKN